jgi:hypothetical protein
MSSAAEETKDVEMVDAPPTLGSAIAVRPHSRSILRFCTCMCTLFPYMCTITTQHTRSNRRACDWIDFFCVCFFVKIMIIDPADECQALFLFDTICIYNVCFFALMCATCEEPTKET